MWGKDGHVKKGTCYGEEEDRGEGGADGVEWSSEGEQNNNTDDNNNKQQHRWSWECVIPFSDTHAPGLMSAPRPNVLRFSKSVCLQAHCHIYNP